MLTEVGKGKGRKTGEKERGGQRRKKRKKEKREKKKHGELGKNTSANI